MKISFQGGLQSVNELLGTLELKASLQDKASERTSMKHEDALHSDPGKDPDGEGRVSL